LMIKLGSETSDSLGAATSGLSIQQSDDERNSSSMAFRKR
jgi:hypothetical protein